MKGVLSYALLIGIAVAGGMAIGDKPKDQTQAWKDYRKRCEENRLALEAQREAYRERERKENLGPCPASRIDWETAELFNKIRTIGGSFKVHGYPVGGGDDSAPRVPEWTPTYSSYSRRESSEESSWIGSKPDLSGIYSTAPMSGPNSGQVQFNYVRGPF